MRHERELRRERQQKRVLQFVNSFHFGGTEGQVVELMRGLGPRYESRVAALHPAGAHLSKVTGLGLQPFEVRLGGSLMRPNSLAQIVRLARHLRRERIELVHAHDFYTALLGVPAAKLAGAKVIVSRLDLAHWLGPIQRLLLAAATRGADYVVVNAEAIKRNLRRVERLGPQRVKVVRNGIDLARFDRQLHGPLASPLPPLEGKTVIVHVANMTHPVKAQEDLFEAMRELLREQQKTVLLLVGDGPRRARLEQLAAQLGISKSVFFLGHRPDVPAVLARADIGVLCSHAEGLSNAIIECMAAGLPMVVTDAGGNRELVRHGVSGYVVPVKSPTALAHRLGALAASKALRARLGKAGRAHVERELALGRMVAAHDAVYRKLLGAKLDVVRGGKS